jgi:hypothetical protein
LQLLANQAIGLVTFHVLVIYSTSRHDTLHTLQLRRAQKGVVATAANWRVHAPASERFTLVATATPDPTAL